MLPRRCNMTKATISAVCVALGQLFMTSLAKQYTISVMKLEKLVTDVYFINALNQW